MYIGCCVRYVILSVVTLVVCGVVPYSNKLIHTHDDESTWFNFTPPRYIVLKNIGIWDIPKNFRYIEIFSFLGYGISQGYPKKNPVHRNFQFFGIWDIPWYIPKKNRYIEIFCFLGYGISLGYPIKFPVHRVSLFFQDMGYSSDIPKSRW